MRRLAAEYDLHLTFHEDFQRIFVEERQDPQFADLLTRMKVVDRQGETEMTMDQWEAASEFLCLLLGWTRGVRREGCAREWRTEAARAGEELVTEDKCQMPS